MKNDPVQYVTSTKDENLRSRKKIGTEEEGRKGAEGIV